MWVKTVGAFPRMKEVASNHTYSFFRVCFKGILLQNVLDEVVKFVNSINFTYEVCLCMMLCEDRKGPLAVRDPKTTAASLGRSTWATVWPGQASCSSHDITST
jgi:hypothetical protein